MSTLNNVVITLSPISPLLKPPTPPTLPKSVATIIDHTLLSPVMTTSECERVCEEARKYNFASVCIPPSFVTRAKEMLEGCDSKVCTVVGFPNGYSTSEVKGYETAVAVKEGADEVDMVCNVGYVKEITKATEEGEWGRAGRYAEDYIR